MRKILLIISVVLLAASANAYDGDPKQQTAAFFKDLLSGKQAEAVENLYAGNPLLSQKPQQMVLLKQQVASTAALYGKLLGTENMYTEQLTPSLVRIVELAKYEYHPIIWEIYFYKPKEKWIASQGIFVDQFQVVGSKK